MRVVPRNRFGRWLLIAAGLAALGVAGALLVAKWGIINVGASAGHPEPVEKFLELALRGSVHNHSSDLKLPDDLESMDRVRLGAAHFAGGCAECHGEPGAERNPIYDYMLPVPPDLAVMAPTWSAREQFFIVRNGLQFTGMPEWSGGDHDDEVWSMVAFLQALPRLSVADYRSLASGNAPEAAPAARGSAEQIAADGVAELARAACDRCHDTAQAAPPSALVPRLAGQNAGYLARSLREYRRGERRSGFMQPVAALLTDAQIDALAAFYSRMPAAEAAAPQTQLTDAQQAEAAAIATGSHAELRLPACISCHRAGARADYPVLAGQSPAYLSQQLRRFRSGERAQSAWGEVMTVIAEHLEPGQVDLLATWLAQYYIATEE